MCFIPLAVTLCCNRLGVACTKIDLLVEHLVNTRSESSVHVFPPEILGLGGGIICAVIGIQLNKHNPYARACGA